MNVRVTGLCLSLMMLSLGSALAIGGSGVGLDVLWNAVFFSEKVDFISKTILFDIRLPRVAIAALSGCALAAAGVLSQGVFRNPLASPSVIGTTAGGSTAAAFTFYFGINTWHWLSLPLAAFAGCAAATILILTIASNQKFMMIENLLLAGFALNAFLGAVSALIISLVLEDHEKFPATMYWMMGGLAAKSWSHVILAVIPIAAGLFFAQRLCRQLDVLSLGEEVATSLSIDTLRLKRHAILVIALLVGTTVSIAGALTFVGLIVPHISRMLIGPSHRNLLGLSCINGVILVVGADTIARTVRAPHELQVGVLIAMLGAPFFLWLLIQRSSSINAERL